MKESKLYLFFGQISRKYIFDVPRNFRDKKGWKSLDYNYTHNMDEFHKHNIGQKKQNTKQYTLHEFMRMKYMEAGQMLCAIAG